MQKLFDFFVNRAKAILLAEAGQDLEADFLSRSANRKAELP